MRCGSCPDRIRSAYRWAETGWGWSPDRGLRDECASIDIDAIAAREQTVTQELDDLRERLMEASENRSNARRESKPSAADDRRGADAATAGSASTEIKEIADNMYDCAPPSCCCSGRSTATDARSRRHAQALGELFAILKRLIPDAPTLEFDEHDKL